MNAVERPLHQLRRPCRRFLLPPAIDSREKPPSRKCPLPQAGSIILNGRRDGAVHRVLSRASYPGLARPNSSIAGSSVRSRMNSSTKTGVWSSAYLFRAASERSWYRSPRNRRVPVWIGEVVDQHARCSASIRWKNRSISPAASPLSQFGRSRIGLCSPKTSWVPDAPQLGRRQQSGNRGR